MLFRSGLNYYMKAYVAAGPIEGFSGKGNVVTAKVGKFTLGLLFARQEDKTSDMGWAIHPPGMGRMFRFLKRYRLPIYVTENGIADADDQHRSEFLLSHLKEVAKAICRGADIRGYYHWSLLDNFEWDSGFAPRFGLVEMDYETMARKTRQSAYAYAKIAKENSVEL